MNEIASDLAEPRNPGVAAVLSLIIPGVGQIYNGDFLRGIFWLIITPGFWVFSAGLFGWPFHFDFRIHGVPPGEAEEPLARVITACY